VAFSSLEVGGVGVWAADANAAMIKKILAVSLLKRDVLIADLMCPDVPLRLSIQLCAFARN
jgi:hypothetical protein